MKKSDWKAYLARIPRRVSNSLSHNLALKLLSVVFALFLWSYVISTTPSISREKTLSGIDVTVSGQSVLASRGLALLTDISSELPSARVQVDVAQSNFSQVTPDTIRIDLDLSGVRNTGKQMVKLRGISTYGAVVKIWPEAMELEVEKQDQRYVPINAELIGETDPSHWYNVSRINPAQITVTGPTSLVKLVSSAKVSVDMTGQTGSQFRTESLVLLDAQGAEIQNASLSRSSSTAMVNVDVYPTKELPVATGIDESIKGILTKGYVIEDIDVQPETIVVAGEQSLLDSLSELVIEPVDVTRAHRTFTAVARVSALKGIKNLSSEEVTVTVTLGEQTLTKHFTSIPVTGLNLPEGLGALLSKEKIEVRVTGDYSTVQALSRTSLNATVNLSGLTAGEYSLPIQVTADNAPDLQLTANPASITVVAYEKNGAP